MEITISTTLQRHLQANHHNRVLPRNKGQVSLHYAFSPHLQIRSSKMACRDSVLHVLQQCMQHARYNKIECNDGCRSRIMWLYWNCCNWESDSYILTLDSRQWMGQYHWNANSHPTSWEMSHPVELWVRWFLPSCRQSTDGAGWCNLGTQNSHVTPWHRSPS